MAQYYVDGEYVEADQAALPLTDMAILRGYAVFDFLRTYQGKPFHLEKHLLRLQKSAKLLHLNCPWSYEFIKEIVLTLLKKNSYGEANVRLLITGGDSIDSITPSDNPRLIVMATELKPFPREWYSEGVKIITSNVTRYIPGSKSTSYLQAIMALRNARKGGAIESIYVNEKGHLLEGTTSNLFAVRNKTIVTPEKDILPGITREVVMELAAEKFDVECDVIKRQSLAEYDELFITSSNKEVVPVTHIDKMLITKKPGTVTTEIMNMFRRFTQTW